MNTETTSLMPVWLKRILLGGLGLILVLMPLHAFVSTWGGSVIGPLWLWKSWKELLLAVLVVATIGWLVWRGDVRHQVFNDNLAFLIAVYVVLNVLMAIVHANRNGLEAVAAGLGMNLRYLAAAVLAYLLLRYSDVSWRQISQWLLGFVLAAGVFVSLLGLIQVFLLPLNFLEQFGYSKDATIAPYILIDENPDAPRAFATLRGPNDFAAFLVLPLIVSILAWKRSRWFILTTAVIGLAIFESSSRSAWLGAMVAIASMLVITYGKRILRDRRFLISGFVAVVAAGAIFAAALSIPEVRLEVFHSSPSDPSLTEGSTDKHWEASADGVQRVVAAPFGCGVGCAGPASYYTDGASRISENYYIQIAEEIGLFGLGLWVAIVGVVSYRLYRLREQKIALALLASFAGISLIGLWLHVWADDPLSLIWWTMAGSTLGAASRQAQKQV